MFLIPHSSKPIEHCVIDLQTHENQTQEKTSISIYNVLQYLEYNLN